jgi:hypothetical protein
MIKIVITVEEQKDGVHVKGRGEEVGGPPTPLEVSFVEDLMMQINTVTGGFAKEKTYVPLTIIKTVKKDNEHPNRN